jgi:LuxR family maltose regulon positive regulatory protein
MLSNAIAATDAEILICLDDFHVLSDSSSTELLSQLMLAPHSTVMWVIASRVTPASLPLGRLRLLNELLEIDARSLKFAGPECREFLDLALGESLEPALADLLAERTEGWAAGLQMASLSLRAAEDRDALIRGFSGTNRNVADFLQAAVLASLEEHTLRFLLDTSVLLRLNAEVCNFVTGRTDARAQLDLLESLNLFIFSLDDERRWYRYHHLFAVFLEQRLRDSDPERVRALHLRASEWFDDAGFGLEAIEHALRARDYVRAARQLDRLSLYERGQVTLLERLAARIPEPVLEQFPNLQLERIWGWEADWDFVKSRAGLNRLKRVLQEWRNGSRPVPEDVDPDYIAAKIAHREMMVLFVSDDMAGTRKICREWLAARHCADTHMQVSTEGALMAAQREHYECSAVDVATAALHERYQRAGLGFGEIFQYCVSGLSLFHVGDLARAREMFERSFAAAVSLHGRLSPLASMPALLLAELHYERNELAEARALVTDYLDIAHGLGFVDKLIAGYLTKAKLEASEGQYEIAQRTLDEAERAARVSGFSRLLAHVASERLRQSLLRGELELTVEQARQAELLGSCINLQPREGVTSYEETLAIAWARAARARSDLDGAIRLIRNWCRFTTERQCGRAAMRLSIELAKLLYARNDFSAAGRQICEAVRLGVSHGFVRTFVDGGEEVRQLLSNAVVSGELQEREAAYAREVLQAFAGGEPAVTLPTRAAVAVRPAQFNQREIDILELAASDVPNREIARRLFLSEHTVKWYWKQIFGKLAVHRRLQAVISAREAGLIC